VVAQALTTIAQMTLIQPYCAIDVENIPLVTSLTVP